MMLVVIFLIIIIVAIFDVYSKSIPNWLIGVGTCFVLAEKMVYQPTQVLSAFIGAGLMFLLWWPAWHAGFFGGGDHKFLVFMGAVLGKDGVLPATFLTAIIGGLLSAILVCKNKLIYYQNAGWMAVVKRTRVPYGVAIAMAGLIMLLMS